MVCFPSFYATYSHYCVLYSQDIYENGVLDIGLEVPSGEQVKLMKNQGATDLIGAWREMSDQIVVESGLQKEATAAIAKHGLRSLTGGSTPLRLSTCHGIDVPSYSI